MLVLIVCELRVDRRIMAMKKIYLTIAAILGMVILSVCSCSPTTTSQAPTATLPLTTLPQVLNGGTFLSIPTGGTFIQAGTTLSLYWSADGNLEAYIFTANQFKNFNPKSIPTYYMAHGAGSKEIITAVVQNSDTVYGVVFNKTASSVQLYQVVFSSNRK